MSELHEPFLEPDEWAGEWCDGWISRVAFPHAGEALAEAKRLLGIPSESIKLKPVLLREESEVEANINGHEFPLWVECTKRAKRPVPYWRIEADRG